MKNTGPKIIPNIETNISNDNLINRNLNRNRASSEYDYDFELQEEPNQKNDMFKKNSKDLNKNIVNKENPFEAKNIKEKDINLNDNRFKDFYDILEETKDEEKKYKQKKCKSATKISLYTDYINDLVNEETKNLETDSKINENKNEKSKNELDIIQEDIEKEDRNTLNVKTNENEIIEKKRKEIKNINDLNNNENILDEIVINQNNMNNDINNNTNSLKTNNKPILDGTIYYNNYLSSTARNNDKITNTYFNINLNTNRYSYKSSSDIFNKFNQIKTENNISTHTFKSTANTNNNDGNVFTSTTYRFKPNEESIQQQNIHYTQNFYYKNNYVNKNRVSLINRSKNKNNVIENIDMTNKKPKEEKIVCDSNRVYVFSLQKIPKSSKKYSMVPKNLINNYFNRNYSNNNDFNSLYINFNSVRIKSSDKNIKTMSNDDCKYLSSESKSSVNINLSNAANNIKINNIREKINNNYASIKKMKFQQQKISLRNRDNILGNITASFMKKNDNDYIINDGIYKTTPNKIKKVKNNKIDMIDFEEDDFYNPKKTKLSNSKKFNIFNDNKWNYSKKSNNFKIKFNDKFTKGFKDIGEKLDFLFNDIHNLDNIEKMKTHTTKLKSTVLPINAFQSNNFMQTKPYNRWFNY